jgi:hypothetical protein
MQKYRADKSEKQSDGATLWRTEWIGGPTLARINDCRLDNMAGDMRRTVYITGEADTYFSIPAACKLAGVKITGYVTNDDAGNAVFRHCYY